MNYNEEKADKIQLEFLVVSFLNTFVCFRIESVGHA